MADAAQPPPPGSQRHFAEEERTLPGNYSAGPLSPKERRGSQLGGQWQVQPGDVVTGGTAGGGPRLSVLFFSDTYRPYVSGVVTSMDTYARQLRARGHRVTIIAPEYPGAPLEPDVVRLPSMPLPAYPRLRLIAPVSRTLQATLQDLAPDIVHTHSPFAVGLFGQYVAREAACPTVFTCHSFYEEYMRYLPSLSQPLRSVLRKYLVNYCGQCQLVLAPSRHLRDFLQEIGVEAPLEILPTGVEPRPAPAPAPGDGPQPECGPNGRPEDFVLTFVGRLAKEKNADLALHTLFDLSRRPNGAQKRWRLQVIGGGPEAERLQNLSVELGIRSIVNFLGELPHTQVFDRLHRSHLLLFTSRVETQGLAMLEAMAAGLPVVAADSPAARDLIDDGRSGRVVADSAAAMADAVWQLAGDRALLTLMGRCAQERSQEFHPALLARQLEARYLELKSAGIGGGATPVVTARQT